MPERDAEAIKRDIENARVTLARSVDQLAYRTSPKRVVENTKTTLKQKAQTPQGKAVIGGKDVEAGPGACVYIPANTIHSGGATAASDVVFFTVKDASHSLHGIKAA